MLWTLILQGVRPVTAGCGSDTLACVMEHLPDDRKALGEIHRILKPGGLLFVFSPKGITFHGMKTIVRGRDAAGHIVLTVVVRGDKIHGYQLRAVNGGKQSKWLKLKNKRAVLVATLSTGIRPTLTKAH